MRLLNCLHVTRTGTSSPDRFGVTVLAEDEEILSQIRGNKFSYASPSFATTYENLDPASLRNVRALEPLGSGLIQLRSIILFLKTRNLGTTLVHSLALSVYQARESYLDVFSMHALERRELSGLITLHIREVDKIPLRDLAPVILDEEARSISILLREPYFVSRAQIVSSRDSKHDTVAHLTFFPHFKVYFACCHVPISFCVNKPVIFVAGHQ